jgi:hypothetical protein
MAKTRNLDFMITEDKNGRSEGEASFNKAKI